MCNMHNVMIIIRGGAGVRGWGGAKSSEREILPTSQPKFDRLTENFGLLKSYWEGGVAFYYPSPALPLNIIVLGIAISIGVVFIWLCLVVIQLSCVSILLLKLAY